jgi:glycyl-tRNA synthetase beta chain
MAQLLLELFSEEIPARMQGNAARELERMARERLTAAGLTPQRLVSYAGPRRLTLVVEGLPVAQGDVSEELKGPRVGSPPQAIEGFLKKTGLKPDQLIERDGVYYATLTKTGGPTSEIIARMVDEIVRGFPWPKSMRWGNGTLRWVRPLKRILCVFDRQIVPFDIDGIASGDITEGHRFMGNGQPFRACDFTEYREALAGHFVVLDGADRKATILKYAKAACVARGLELVEDEGLLEEVSGLAEWPVPVLGDMDPAFLSLPPEVIRTSMRTHQKYFAVRDPKTGVLAPHFLTVANIEASDGGIEIAAGNTRVLSARLDDARFFWDEDIKVGFEPWLGKLSGVTFHAKLGTMAQRVERIVALARQIAPMVGADPDKAADAARLAKADLASGMVGEFPELQGLMGGYYARAAAMDGEIADALRDQYRPMGPSDTVPTAPLSVAVALADKLDTLVGFFSIDEKPTGSKDPYALRRSALGVIRIVLENALRLPMGRFASDDLRGFFADRLKVTLRDQGKRHDLVDAVFALGDDDLMRIVARVEALSAFLATENGANLLAGYKRATNILRAEEKKSGWKNAPSYLHDAEPPEETELRRSLQERDLYIRGAIQDERFGEAMKGLAELRGPVDAFFEKVLVNSDIPEERENRLNLLAEVRGLMDQVADFSLVAG